MVLGKPRVDRLCRPGELGAPWLVMQSRRSPGARVISRELQELSSARGTWRSPAARDCSMLRHRRKSPTGAQDIHDLKRL